MLETTSSQNALLKTQTKCPRPQISDSDPSNQEASEEAPEKLGLLKEFGSRVTRSSPLTGLADFSFEQLRFFLDLFIRKGQDTTLYSALSLPRVPHPHNNHAFSTFPARL